MNLFVITELSQRCVCSFIFLILKLEYKFLYHPHHTKLISLQSEISGVILSNCKILKPAERYTQAEFNKLQIKYLGKETEKNAGILNLMMLNIKRGKLMLF